MLSQLPFFSLLHRNISTSQILLNGSCFDDVCSLARKELRSLRRCCADQVELVLDCRKFLRDHEHRQSVARPLFNDESPISSL